jgi:branched-subunit amino acid aminotransferase/4-amino-4-deoxychorismate lyase
MHTHVFLNERLVEASKARLRATGGAALHGRGVFTTLAVHSGRPFLWAAHWARLTEHARRAGVECPFDEEETRDALARLVEKNEVVRGRARITILARGAAGPWGVEGETAEGERGSDLLLMTGDARGVDEEALALTVSPFRLNTHSPLAGLKALNYLEHVLAWEEARGRDFDESLVLNERGEVASATMANVFWVKQGTLHTPALATADEIFLTSSGLGVSLVTTFDFHRYTVPVGSVALRLREAFRQLTLGVD